jgi:hypothetical protein
VLPIPKEEDASTRAGGAQVDRREGQGDQKEQEEERGARDGTRNNATASQVSPSTLPLTCLLSSSGVAAPTDVSVASPIVSGQSFDSDHWDRYHLQNSKTQKLSMNATPRTRDTNPES